MRVVFDGRIPDQTGFGPVPTYFKGSSFQKGHGIGSFLSGLFRMALPFAQRGVKALGKQALSTGMDIASDVLEGENLGESARRRGIEAGKALLEKAKRKQSGRGLGRRNIPRTLSPIKRRRVSSKKRTARAKKRRIVKSKFIL